MCVSMIVYHFQKNILLIIVIIFPKAIFISMNRIFPLKIHKKVGKKSNYECEQFLRAFRTRKSNSNAFDPSLVSATRNETGRFMKGTTMRQDKCSQQALTTIGDVFKFKHIIFTEYQQYQCKKNVVSIFDIRKLKLSSLKKFKGVFETHNQYFGRL